MRSWLTFTFFAVFVAACIAASPDNVATSSSISKLISFRGTTVAPLGRLLVLVPGAAVPSGNTGCLLEAETAGSAGDYGLHGNETVWDVRILCDREELQVLFGAIIVCIQPANGARNGMQVYQRHGTGDFEALAQVDGREGYVCGATERLSLFTIG